MSMLVPRSDASEFRRRYRVLVSLVLVAFLAVVARLFLLQIVTGADYAEIARENILRRVTLPTTRGVIRDARGLVLASSRISYNVFVVSREDLARIRKLHLDYFHALRQIVANGKAADFVAVANVQLFALDDEGWADSALVEQVGQRPGQN